MTELHCERCKTVIRGEFDLPELAALNKEDEAFLEVFLAARGSIKEVERRLGLSYPTVKARLASLLEKLGLGYQRPEAGRKRAEILDMLELGTITPEEAVKRLKEPGI